MSIALIIIMDNQSTSKYGQLCTIHGEKMGMYCPHCDKFRCHLCNDSHITTGDILHGCQIQAIIEHQSYHKERDILTQAKSQLILLFKKSLQTLKDYINEELNAIAKPKDKSFDELIAKIQPKTMRVIEEIANSMTAKKLSAAELSKEKKLLIALIEKGKILSTFIKKLGSSNDKINAFQFFEYSGIANNVKSMKLKISALPSFSQVGMKRTPFSIIHSTNVNSKASNLVQTQNLIQAKNVSQLVICGSKNITSKLIDIDALYETLTKTFYDANKQVLENCAINEQTIILFRKHLDKFLNTQNMTLDYNEKKKNIIWEYLLKCSFEDNNFHFKAPLEYTLMNSSYFAKLNGWIGRACKYTLLFRASRDGFAASAFHSRCDNKGPTVTIIKTEYDRVIGGYTTVSWDSTSSYKNDGNAFLFSMTVGAKYKVTDPECAIYCGPNYGPTFGAHSLYVCDNSSVSNGSYTCPTHYECDGGLGGATNNGNTCYFKVIEYEVLSVSDA